MKRRLLIGKALVHRPRVVFLDEPTAGVDVALRRDLWSYVRRLRQEGTTIVLTTHYLEEAEALADRVAVIDHGQLVGLDTTAALLARFGNKQIRVRLTAPVAGAGRACVVAAVAARTGSRSWARPSTPAGTWSPVRSVAWRRRRCWRGSVRCNPRSSTSTPSSRRWSRSFSR